MYIIYITYLPKCYIYRNDKKYKGFSGVYLGLIILHL